MAKIMVVGDIHADWVPLNSLIEEQRPDIILQCGDFGWWPSLEKFKARGAIDTKGGKLYFCDGNHEQHSDLDQEGGITELYENVFFCPRGSTLTLDDGRIVLFAGGAHSIDKNQRIMGLDWFEEENITYSQFDRMVSHKKVDIVISHTAPREIKMSGEEDRVRDPNRDALQAVLELYSPSLWFFGHWHRHKSGTYKDTIWCCLDYYSKNGDIWCIELPED